MCSSGGDKTRAKILRDAVHVVEPSHEAAERIWRYYQQAYRDDDELIKRTCDPDTGIDGLTESVTVADIYQSMRMPDTVTFEAMPASAGPGGGGFVIVPYATGAPESRARFADYFFGNVFDRAALRFRCPEDQSTFMGELERGYVLYFAEFVSTGGREVTSALMLAVYEEICARRFGAAPATILGKCLDAVKIGDCTNLHGNRQVKALATSLGLEKIALCDQVRPLRCMRPEMIAKAFSQAPDLSGSLDSVLTFALYRGPALLAMRAIAARI